MISPRVARAASRLAEVAQAHPMLTFRPSPVLADFVANRARRALRHESLALQRVEGELVEDLGVGVRSGAPDRSHLAATGESLRLLRNDRSRRCNRYCRWLSMYRFPYNPEIRRHYRRSPPDNQVPE